MSKTTQSIPTPHVYSSTGLSGTETGWLDVHFEACRSEYEEMVRSVGIQPGWHVLDAGCGSGGFLPLLGELVGPQGTVTALDSDPDLIPVVEERLAAGDWTCPITTKLASLTEPLPFPDATFDAVWCANTTQYFTDNELAETLLEFRRVVRPGGLVAIKDYDACFERWQPGDPTMRWRWIGARARQDSSFGVQMLGVLRTGIMRRWLERAGLEQVWQRTVPIEFWAPLSPVEQEFLKAKRRYNPDDEDLGLPDPVMDYLRAEIDLKALEDPEFHGLETNVLAVGIVPG